jgi:hypothetical protein
MIYTSHPCCGADEINSANILAFSSSSLKSKNPSSAVHSEIINYLLLIFNNL